MQSISLEDAARQSDAQRGTSAFDFHITNVSAVMHIEGSVHKYINTRYLLCLCSFFLVFFLFFFYLKKLYIFLDFIPDAAAA